MTLYERLTDEFITSLKDEKEKYPDTVISVEEDLKSTDYIYDISFRTFDSMRYIAELQLGWEHSYGSHISNYFKQ